MATPDDSLPARPLEQPRLELLAQLVPASVHELNNVLAVLRGALEIVVHDTGDVGARQALQEAEKATRLLVRLSTFAKGDADPEGAVDLGQLLLDQQPLFLALAKSRSVAFELEAEAGLALVRGDGRGLARALVILGLAWIEAAAGQPNRSRVRVSLRTEAQHAVLRWAGTTGARGQALDPGLPGEVAAALEAALTNDVELVLERRVLRGARGLRLRVPATVLGQAVAAQPRPTSPRILLLGVGGTLDEELEELLASSGYRVLPREPELDVHAALLAASADLVLVDARVLPASPTLLSHLLNEHDQGLAPLLLLGPDVGIGSLPAVPQPCPPDQLLEAIEAALSG